MIEAIIHYHDSTLIVDLPRSIYDIHEKLMSIGCPTAPGRIPLTDNEDDALRVKLYGRIEMGNHLIRILSEQNTLADANTLAFAVLNASDDIKLKLGEKIVKDQYGSIPEIVADIRQMTYDAGPIKRTFYCPLVGNIEDGYDDTFTVGSSFLRDYESGRTKKISNRRIAAGSSFQPPSGDSGRRRPPEDSTTRVNECSSSSTHR